jgi:hypothetical protein
LLCRIRKPKAADHSELGFERCNRFRIGVGHNSDQCLSQAFDLVQRLLPVLARGGGPA